MIPGLSSIKVCTSSVVRGAEWANGMKTDPSSMLKARTRIIKNLNNPFRRQLNGMKISCSRSVVAPPNSILGGYLEEWLLDVIIIMV